MSVPRGATDFGESPDMQKEVEKLKEKKLKLVELEDQIDQQCSKIVQCLRNIVDDPDSNKYPSYNLHVNVFIWYIIAGCSITCTFFDV